MVSGPTSQNRDGTNGGPTPSGKDIGLSEETLNAVRERDPEALSELFEGYFDRLFSLAYRLLGDRAAAEDVSQDVFLKVYNAAHQLDPTRDPGPWLTTITYNACREYWRSRGRKAEGRSQSLNGSPVLKETLTNGRRDPEGSTLDAERESQVMKAVMKLSEPLRAVVVLYDYQGLSHEEIAVMLETSSATVRKRYSRALARLRSHLKDIVS